MGPECPEVGVRRALLEAGPVQGGPDLDEERRVGHRGSGREGLGRRSVGQSFEGDQVEKGEQCLRQVLAGGGCPAAQRQVGQEPAHDGARRRDPDRHQRGPAGEEPDTACDDPGCHRADQGVRHLPRHELGHRHTTRIQGTPLRGGQRGQRVGRQPAPQSVEPGPAVSPGDDTRPGGGAHAGGVRPGRGRAGVEQGEPGLQRRDRRAQAAGHDDGTQPDTGAEHRDDQDPGGGGHDSAPVRIRCRARGRVKRRIIASEPR
ncbi:hypothetical protein SDC9_123948 [bioreactor metagenome]|uniref:Uncharacterized protein n=1 Tax=bioreactor metagenome TaxID=1076179 RepID=A0A645CJ22_9ZZZZ